MGLRASILESAAPVSWSRVGAGGVLRTKKDFADVGFKPGSTLTWESGGHGGICTLLYRDLTGVVRKALGICNFVFGLVAVGGGFPLQSCFLSCERN